MAPPRYSPGCGFQVPRAVRRPPTPTPMQAAVKGERGYGEGIDYRGQPVVAAWSYLPSYRWGMVVKQDVDEAFSLVNHQRTLYSPASGGDNRRSVGRHRSLALPRTITQPIREAAQVTEQVASGDLTVSCESGAGRARIAASGNPQDDRRPSLVDWQDSALEHHTPVDRHRDCGNIPPAGTSRFRLMLPPTRPPSPSTRSRPPGMSC